MCGKFLHSLLGSHDDIQVLTISYDPINIPEPVKPSVFAHACRVYCPCHAAFCFPQTVGALIVLAFLVKKNEARAGFIHSIFMGSLNTLGCRGVPFGTWHGSPSLWVWLLRKSPPRRQKNRLPTRWHTVHWVHWVQKYVRSWWAWIIFYSFFYCPGYWSKWAERSFHTHFRWSGELWGLLMTQFPSTFGPFANIGGVGRLSWLTLRLQKALQSRRKITWARTVSGCQCLRPSLTLFMLGSRHRESNRKPRLRRGRSFACGEFSSYGSHRQPCRTLIRPCKYSC